MEGYQVYLAKTTMDGKRITYYEIVFDRPEMKEKFLGAYDENILKLFKEDDQRILFRLIN
jgi:hypothetical protein